MAGALCLAVLAAIYAGPAEDVVKPRPLAQRETPVASNRSASPAQDALAATTVPADPDLEQLRRRLHPSEAAQEIKNAFVPRTWVVAKPAPQPIAASPAASVASTPPAPPPLPFKYLGQLNETGRTLVFLSRDEAPVVGQVGETLDGGYRIDKVADTAIEFTYLPMNARQVLAIGGLQ
ncbi:MAG: hypothetical protein IT531_05625 [Burkholderiales bacterium]|nr:hypothetical protein [Burkholderiales bacterium]